MAPETDADQVPTEAVRLACGYSYNVWPYISGHLIQYNIEKIATGDRSARYLVRNFRGEWLVAIEFINSDLDEDNTTCIVMHGKSEPDVAAISKPVDHLPAGVISGRVSVPPLTPQRTSKNLL